MRRSHAIALILCLVPVCVFAQVFRAQFVEWDDPILIFQNPHLNPPRLAGLLWHWMHAHDQMYIPLVYTVWWGLIRAAGVPDPLLMHSANLLLHIGSTCLVYRIVRRLVGQPWPAAAGAILFAVHPMQVEAVAWATGMKDVLSGFLALAALATYLRFTQTRAKLHYVAATALFLLALLAKPAVAPLPLVAMTLELAAGGASLRRAATFLVPWLIAAAVFLLIAARVQVLPSIPYVWPGGRILVASDALAFYLWKLVWPVHLCMDYGRQPAVVLSPYFDGLSIAQLTWIAPVGVALLIAATRNRILIAAGLIFVFSLLSVLGLHPFAFQNYSTVADRYVYLAMLGPALATTFLLGRFAPLRAPAVGLLAVLGVLSFVQCGYWRDTETLCLQAISVNPGNVLAHHNLGLILANRGDVAGAMAEYQAVIAIDPANPQVQPEYRYVADAEAASGDFAAAADYAGRLIALQPVMPPDQRQDLGELHRWRGGIYLREGVYQSAADDFAEALRLNPGDAAARDGLLAAQAGLKVTSPPPQAPAGGSSK
jgi:protein O-mannosyl-transferase